MAGQAVRRAEILDAAAACVLRDRNVEHGSPENTFGLIAGLWSAYLAAPIAAHDVAALMSLLKIARLRSNPSNDDNWVDLAGYAACGAELADLIEPQPVQAKARFNGIFWACPDGLGGMATGETEDEVYRVIRDRNGEA